MWQKKNFRPALDVLNKLIVKGDMTDIAHFLFKKLLNADWVWLIEIQVHRMDKTVCIQRLLELIYLSLLKGAYERIGGGLVIAMRENGDRESWCIERFMVH